MDAVDGFYNDVMNRQLLLNVEYTEAGRPCVSLSDPETKEDIAKGLLSSGFVLVEQRKEKRFFKLMSEYTKAMDVAKSNRVSDHACLTTVNKMWRNLVLKVGTTASKNVSKHD